MLSSLLKYTLLFVLLVLLQALVWENISVLGYATPYLYIYFVIKLPIGLNRYLITFLGFILGLTIDMFANTPGLAAAATTFVAFFRRPIQGLCFERDGFSSFIPGISILGGGFMKYAVICVFLHHAILLLLESFSYFNIQIIALKILSSTILTSLLIFAVDSLASGKKKV